MQRYIIASDVHGSAFWCEKLLRAFRDENADKLLFLGDLLYHGPRNPFPDDYAPQTVCSVLNALNDRLLCVRGNCDSEVDQMVLDFPIMADYAILDYPKGKLFLTHGHLYNPDKLPPMQTGDVLCNGHFHVPAHYALPNGALYVNCGSIALPKGGSPHSYILFDGEKFVWKDLATGAAFDEVVL